MPCIIIARTFLLDEGDRQLVTSPAFRLGNAQLRTAFVLSAPGKAECKAQRPAAGQTGITLTSALSTFHGAEPGIFPSLCLDDYTLVNAWDKVEYKARTGRTEATNAEILGVANICRLAQCFQYMDAIVALGDKAQLAVDTAWPAGTIFTGDHPSLQRLNRAYRSCANAPSKRRIGRTRQWAICVLNSKRRR
ncbi:MAG: hypothetical protein F4114_09050 [Rhodospirillaceae bacterium]|nr:hypothetical protein [Rhodospirillaceae bacterium]MYB14316.1 hypothetical protein [Rhodospirillaceae bacterium]MYI49221.1 hypothetical protein [Rhodospirillaceae bacterium]